MNDIQKKALDNALRLLTGLGCQYVVIDADGVKHGEIAESRKKRRPNKYPMGTFSSYLRPYITPLNVGGSVDVPFGQFDGFELQSSIASLAHKLWGSNAHMSSVNRAKQIVEVIRIA